MLTRARSRHVGHRPIAGRQVTHGPVQVSPGWRLIAGLLIIAAALDVTRCSLVLMTYRHLAPAVVLVAAGIAAAALSMAAARGYRTGHRWASAAAILIGIASAPLASAAGFRAPLTIPDVATSIVGVVLAVAVLAAVGRGAPAQDAGCYRPRGKT